MSFHGRRRRRGGEPDWFNNLGIGLGIVLLLIPILLAIFR